MNQEKFERIYLKKEANNNGAKCKNALGNTIRHIANCSPLAKLYSFIPILYWLPKYKWRQDLHGDIIGGLTVGIMHVPQGMAYATLASLPPVYGLYSSFFAALIYAFFGTSRHISIGAFAVGSMMVGSTRLKFLPDQEIETNFTTFRNGTIKPEENQWMMTDGLTPVMVTSALTFAVGVAQIVMAMLRLGFLTTYLSDPLVSGFTTGAAFHVFMAQINKILGVKLPRYNGVGQLFFMLRDLVEAIPSANIYTVGLSVFGIVFLKAGKTWINPFVKKRLSVPFPLELTLVIISTVFSSIFSLKRTYGIQIVDYVPQGVPKPRIPQFHLIPPMFADAIGIAFVCYTFVISMGKLFAKKRKYNIDPGQELYAVSFMSMLSSFFPVYPCGASLSRSTVCEQSGARTQLYTLFSSILLLAVIIWIGPLLEPLPMCILSCIVVVSLESLFLQARELPLLWKVSPFDFFIWIVACVATVCTTVTYGLLIAVSFNILSITLREQWPKLRVLGRFKIEGIYKPETYYSCLPTSDRIKILRFDAPLHFANVDKFKAQYEALLSTLSTQQLNNIQLERMNENVGRRDSTTAKSCKETAEDYCKENGHRKPVGPLIIIDCSRVTYLDNMGLSALKEAYFDARNIGWQMVLADLTENVLDVFRKVGLYSEIPELAVYPNVQQAILSSCPEP